MKYMKYVLDVVVYSCCIIGVVMLILMATGFKFVSIKTGSMVPTINIGDLCLVRELEDTDDIRQGDIVTFEVEGTYVTHRIVSDNGDGSYSTKGDANKVYDNSKLSKEDILGKVSYVIPSVGVVLEFVTDKNGKAVLVAGLVLLVSLSLVFDTVVSRREKKKHIKDKTE